MDFIISGILHLQKAESENAEENIQGRELKYAFLHSSSGIELVFKSRLNIEHRTYIFEDMKKTKKDLYISSLIPLSETLKNVVKLFLK